MSLRSKGKSQAVAAAKVGISQRRGRDIEQGKWVDPKQRGRYWRTSSDPLADVWEQELVPMLVQQPALKAITLLEYLQDKYSEKYSDRIERTLQRRVKQWQALQGPEKEVMFRQIHEPGRQGLSDFTQLKRVTVTIAGKPFEHLLYHFRLAYSHWSYMKVIEGDESYTALTEGLQEALQKLGGSPQEHRTDSLSAGFKNVSRDTREDMTIRYDAFCRHYGMIATRNNRGKGHENGSIEAPHGHLKRRLEQALLLRASHDFISIAAYQTFIHSTVEQFNRRHGQMITKEREALQPLPATSAADYSEVRAVVSRSSTIEVRRVIYTVPSRLQGEVLTVRIYDNRLICYLSGHHVITLQRVRLNRKGQRARQVDYRHVIHSLIKKPQAFRYSQLRDDLLPDDNYRAIWPTVNQRLPAQEACTFMVGLLYLAATSGCEKVLGETVMSALNKGQSVSLSHFQKQFSKSLDNHNVQILHPQLETYNRLIPVQETHHAS